MKLAELTEGIGTLLEPETGGLDINHLTHDSQKAQYGSIFVAIEGSRADGLPCGPPRSPWAKHPDLWSGCAPARR